MMSSTILLVIRALLLIAGCGFILRGCYLLIRMLVNKKRDSSRK
jgi:outer membrane lipopolysaccharide assembly protein LptE/RlpB